MCAVTVEKKRPVFGSFEIAQQQSNQGRATCPAPAVGKERAGYSAGCSQPRWTWPLRRM
jgi:hypothetical protein